MASETVLTYLDGLVYGYLLCKKEHGRVDGISPTHMANIFEADPLDVLAIMEALEVEELIKIQYDEEQIPEDSPDNPDDHAEN